MNQNVVSVVVDVLGQSSPFILAALGGLVSEYAGMLNIGLEGLMLSGAFSALLGASLAAGGNGGVWGALVGVVCALASGFGWGLLLSTASIRFKGNIFITGLALNLLLAGCVSIFSSALFGTRSVISLDAAHAVPRGFAGILFVALALGLCAVLWFFVRTTRIGMRLRVTGSNTPMLQARGVDTRRIQWWALVASCMLASLAGAGLSLQLGSFVPNQSAGEGWIALVLIFVGARTAPGIALASIAFVFAERAAFAAQTISAHPALLVGMPFFLVLAALVFVQIVRRLLRRL